METLYDINPGKQVLLYSAARLVWQRDLFQGACRDSQEPLAKHSASVCSHAGARLALLSAAS